MKIIHFTMFAPNACGLYEASRDMVVADRMAGHDSNVVDVGIYAGDNHIPGSPGKVDDRGAHKIISVDPEEAVDADVLIAHTGVPDPWIAWNQAPLIWVLHGRPLACFRPEQNGGRNSYSLIAGLAQKPRIKAMLSFWPHHSKYWEPIIPNEKLFCLVAPPIDEFRFSPYGDKHFFGIMGGDINVMVAESWREDVDIYEITHGMIQAAKDHKGIKFHFYGMETNVSAWNYLLDQLRNLGALGEVWTRKPNIEEVYRAADIMLSPQRIVTRTVGEALSCGLPVIAAHGCEHATFRTTPDEPETVSDSINTAITALKFNKDEVMRNVNHAAESFSLHKYSKAMNKLYEKIV